MPTFIALLRAINVGGRGKLPMADLKAMCAAEGFEKVRTYIASGNVLFSTKLSEAKIKAALEKRLRAYAGAPMVVVVRTAREMTEVLAANPYPDRAASRTVAIFLDAPPPADTVDSIRGRADDEEVRLGKREIYVLYGAAGIGRSKLRIPAAEKGTARNMNTVAKLVELAAAASG